MRSFFLFVFLVGGNFRAVSQGLGRFIFVNYNYYRKRASERREVNKYSERKKIPKHIYVYTVGICARSHVIYTYV